MNILVLASFTNSLSSNKYGGAERVLTNLANWLSENTTNKVILFNVESEWKPYKVSNKVIWDCNSFYTRNKIYLQIKILINSLKAIKKYKPDVIISFSIYPSFYSLIARLFRNIKLYFSERNDPKLKYGIIAKFIRWFVMKAADGIVFQTKDAMNYFSDNIKKKSVVIHNPVSVDITKFPIPLKIDNRIVTVGKLMMQKNHKFLINAFNQIKDYYPETTLEIYGDGILKNDLQTYINDLKLEKRVFLKHSRSDVLDCIYGARLFVLPSLFEGMPNALMEAMALGIPVISSDCPCGGPRELIEDGKNGYLFKNNDLDDFVNKIKIVLNKDFPKKICEESRKIILNHSENTIFKKWNKFITN